MVLLHPNPHCVAKVQILSTGGKKTINKKYPEWQEYISDASGVKVWQGKYVDSFKKGAIIARKSGGQLKKPRGWGAARYR